MAYAYRLKNAKDAGRVIEGFGIRRTWQFSSDPKTEKLGKWPMVAFLKADNIKVLKGQIDEYEQEDHNEQPAQGAEGGSGSKSGLPSADGGLKSKLDAMNLTELKQFARDNGLDEAEYSTLTKSKLAEYLLLAVPEKK